MAFILRPFELFKKTHVLADWNGSLHSYQDTDNLGYLKITLQKEHPRAKNGHSPYTFEMRAGFIIEVYDYMKTAGFYAMKSPVYDANKDIYFVTPCDGWTIHPCLLDAFDVLWTRVHIMQRDGWKVVKRIKDTKTKYEYSTNQPRTQAKL